jgi:hypothetical protein
MNLHTYSKYEPPYSPDKWKQNTNALHTHNCYSYMLNDLHADARNGHKPQPGEFAARTNNSVSQIIKNINRLDCSVKNAVKYDNVKIKILPLQHGLNHKCKAHHYKGFLMISPNRDYHFARQDNRMIDVYKAIDNDLFNGNLKFSTNPQKLVKIYNSYADKIIPEVVRLAKERKGKPLGSKKRLLNILRHSKLWSHKPGSSEVINTDGNEKLILNPLKASWDFSSTGGINYNINCCFFEIPTNSFAKTFSTGIQGNNVNSPDAVRKDLGISPRERRHEMLCEALVDPSISLSSALRSLKFAQSNKKI